MRVSNKCLVSLWFLVLVVILCCTSDMLYDLFRVSGCDCTFFVHKSKALNNTKVMLIFSSWIIFRLNKV